MNERVPLLFLVPLRVLVGVILVMSGYQKFSAGWHHGTPLLGILDGWMQAHKTFAFFLPVVETARAHPKIFGSLITMGELIVGTSMLLGILSRLFSVLGLLLLLSIAFASGQGLSPPGNAVLMAAIFFTFALLPPGRVLGIDQTLRARLPRWLV